MVKKTARRKTVAAGDVPSEIYRLVFIPSELRGLVRRHSSSQGDDSQTPPDYGKGVALLNNLPIVTNNSRASEKVWEAIQENHHTLSHGIGHQATSIFSSTLETWIRKLLVHIRFRHAHLPLGSLLLPKRVAPAMHSTLLSSACSGTIFPTSPAGATGTSTSKSANGWHAAIGPNSSALPSFSTNATRRATGGSKACPTACQVTLTLSADSDFLSLYMGRTLNTLNTAHAIIGVMASTALRVAFNASTRTCAAGSNFDQSSVRMPMLKPAAAMM